MDNRSYRFKLGRLDCLVVNDGSISMPPPQGEPTGTPHEEMSVLSLVIDYGQTRILIDTGCGTKFKGTSTGHLVENLQAAGVNCRDISTVVFTHGHQDHAAGTFTPDGKPVFPNALYIVAQKEWQCWVEQVESRQITPIFNAACNELLGIPQLFHLAADGEEILPGIRLNLEPGHTPGTSILKISSGQDSLTCLGDIIHSPIEIKRPDYYSFVDSDPGKAILTRQSVVSRMAASGQKLFVSHFPFPGLGHFSKAGKNIVWKGI
jgi:glyoxylase-like metal-dependent hydrolase (beta-lactamase superfamily II)